MLKRNFWHLELPKVRRAALCHLLSNHTCKENKKKKEQEMLLFFFFFLDKTLLKLYVALLKLCVTYIKHKLLNLVAPKVTTLVHREKMLLLSEIIKKERGSSLGLHSPLGTTFGKFFKSQWYQYLFEKKRRKIRPENCRRASAGNSEWVNLRCWGWEACAQKICPCSQDSVSVTAQMTTQTPVQGKPLSFWFRFRHTLDRSSQETVWLFTFHLNILRRWSLCRSALQQGCQT